MMCILISDEKPTTRLLEARVERTEMREATEHVGDHARPLRVSTGLGTRIANRAETRLAKSPKILVSHSATSEAVEERLAVDEVTLCLRRLRAKLVPMSHA